MPWLLACLTSQRPFLSKILMIIGGRTKSPMIELPLTCTSLLPIRLILIILMRTAGSFVFIYLLLAHWSEVHSIDQTTGGLLPANRSIKCDGTDIFVEMQITFAP